MPKRKDKKQIVEEIRSARLVSTDHSRNCNICKHPDLKEIEENFIAGDPSALIAEEYCDSVRERSAFTRSLNRHFAATKLREKRDDSTLAFVDRIISRAGSAIVDPSPRLLGAAMQLRAKLKGEIVEKHEVKATMVDASDDELFGIIDEYRNSKSKG